MVERFIGSGRLQEGGFLATHKRDHVAHVTGEDWRHDATHIDMNPPLTAFPAPDVQGTFQLIAGFAASTGTGFVSVGNVGPDGYAVGSYNAGTSLTPTFREALFSALLDSRLQNGGIVFILAGTYSLNTTIDIPAGISIMGEMAGTIIVGTMSDQPMFRFLRAKDFPTIGGDSGGGDLAADMCSPIDESRLFNITLADNLDGYVGLSGQPDATMLTVPMVEIEAASRMHIENVKFIGRINSGVVLNRGKTLCAIGYASGGLTASHLTVKRCFFDGMQIAIDFSPGHGDIDHLTVDRCRARIFGTEDGVANNATNCFVSMSLCNLLATDNYVVGYGTLPTQVVATCFAISSLGGGGTDVSIHVTGTTGTPSGGLGTNFKSVLANDSGLTAIKATLSGNNWASDLGAKWYVTVAEGDIGDTGYADFSGIGAVDLLLTANFQYPVTVFVNAGTYTITNVGSGRYNFIGNPEEATRPIFDMKLPAGGVPPAPTDEVGNRTFTVGGRIENIHFRSTGAGVPFQSIRPDISGNRFIVKNCEFDNCTLSCSDTLERIEIINCEFSQNNGIADNISLLAPRADYLLMDGCSFAGCGYIGLIGTDTGLGYSVGAASPTSTIVLRNCVMDMTGFTIDNASPLTITSYLVIDGGTSAADMCVEMTGCKILCDNTLTQRIAAVVAPPNPWTSFVFVRARDITIDNCIVHAPTQTDPLIATLLAPVHSVRVINSKFIDGMPLQITGLFNESITGAHVDGVFIHNCFFEATAITESPTLLDIDLDPSVLFSSPNITVSNCNFSIPYDSTPVQPTHWDVRAAGYTALGIVQIFAIDFTINFHDNKIVGTLTSSLPGGMSHLSGLVISNTVNTAGLLGQFLPQIHVHDNEIIIINTLTIASAAVSATDLWINGSTFDIHDNYLQFNNTVGVLASFAGCAYLNSRLTRTAGVPSKALVHNNTFSREDTAGVGTTLSRGYVQMVATSLGGVLRDNIFSTPTIDGALTTIIEDNSALWLIDRNINQTKTCTISGRDGIISNSFDTGALFEYYIRGSNPVTLTVKASQGGGVNDVILNYTTPGVEYFAWHIDLFGLLPVDVEIIEVEITGTSDVTLDVGEFSLILGDFAGTLATGVPTIDFTAAVGPTTSTVTGTGAMDSRNIAENGLYLRLTPGIVAGMSDAVTNAEMTFNDFIITYRW
jgi:hypothetical protein